MIAPILVPLTICTGIPSSSRTFRIPMWANPFAPPPLRARPIFSSFVEGFECCSEDWDRLSIGRHPKNKMRNTTLLKIGFIINNTLVDGVNIHP
jgi:hypothetical protein